MFTATRRNRRWPTAAGVVIGLAALGAAAVGVFALTVGAASGRSDRFELIFDGVQRPATFPSVGELQHEGRFVASRPFCRSGYGIDTRQVFRTPVTAIRLFTCADGSGSITARIDRFPAEHERGGHGAWRIVAGTGRYAGLRGEGTWATASVDGDQLNPATVRFRIRWRGVVAMGAEPSR